MKRIALFLLQGSLWILPGCSSTAETGIQLLKDPSSRAWSSPAPADFRARFETSKGDFIVRFRRDWAPIGVDRVYHLIENGFFDDSRFYRVIENFIVQFGIPGDPSIAGVWRKSEIRDDPVNASNTRGRIAYAMTGPDTRTTQLFISLVDNSRLDEQGFSPLGEVESGMEVVDAIYSGYGESAGGGMRRGNQDRMFNEGNAHLDRDFPELDRLLKVELVR